MEKEKFLTIYRPIRNDDSFVVNVITESDKAPSIGKRGQKYINTTRMLIYTHTGNSWGKGVQLSQNIYYHILDTKLYKVLENNELIEKNYVSFPSIDNPLEIYKFKYESQRMGNAPAITATAMWNVCLDDMWNMDCFTIFNGERYYLKQTPTSSKDNTDARYKHDLIMVSERVILEDIYLFDIVTPYTNEKPITESASFSFFGDIEALQKRINASLINSGLSIVNEDGTISGYQVIIGNDDKGNKCKSEEKLLTFDKSTIFDALSEIDKTFGLKYYFKGKDIVIGDSEIYFDKDTFEYGFDKALLSAEKANDTEKIINKCSGIGSNENIPYYYPNPTEDGFLRPKYNPTKSPNRADIMAVSMNNDAFNKNRLAHSFMFGFLFPKTNEWNIIKKPNSSEYEHVYNGSDDDSPSSVGNIPSNFEYRECKFSFDISTKSGTIKFDNKFPIGSFVNDTSQIDSTTKFYLELYKENENGQEEKVQNFIKNNISNIKLHNCIKLNKGKYILKGWQGILSTKRNRGIINGYYQPKKTYKFVINKRKDNGIHFLKSEINVSSNECFLKKEYYNNGTFIYNRVKPYLKVNMEFFDQIKNKMRWYLIDLENIQKLFDKEKVSQFDGSTMTIVYVKENSLKTQVIPRFDYAYELYKTDGKDIFEEPYSENPKYVGNLTEYYWFDLNTKKTYQYRNGVYEDFIYNSSITEDERNALKIVDGIDSFGFKFTENRWFNDKGKEIELSDFGMYLTTMPLNAEPLYNDKITFERIKYLTPQLNLMPEVYYKTDGGKRFYVAKNYPISNATQGDIDESIGEEFVDGKIRNPIYHDDEKTDEVNTYNQYYFTNEFRQLRPKEHIEEFEDIKPSIVGMLYNGKRIDVVEEFAYDELDSDETWNVSDNNSENLEYKHPHFFAKLRPLGFNLFDCALESGDMTLSMTNGDCGACKFKIKVDSDTLKNPVQIWEFDVYEQVLVGGNRIIYKKIFNKGDLKRNYLKRELYKKTIIDGVETYEKLSTIFYANTYDTNEIVGSLKIGNKEHFEGDVITSGRFQQEQQDTTNSYVWVALEKDIETYGVIMPSAKPTYTIDGVDEQLSIYIRPEAKIDNFIFTNILLPQLYIRDAERKLSKAIVKYMADHNNWKYNFSIKFSRIYLAEHPNIINNLNENSKLHIRYNGVDYIVYVSSYSYNMQEKDSLPDITIELRETISTIKYNYLRKYILGSADKDINGTIAIDDVIRFTDSRYLPKRGDVKISGNLYLKNDPRNVNKNLENSVDFEKKIELLTLFGDDGNLSLFELRDYQNKIIERSNELTKILQQLQVSINTFNQEAIDRNLPSINEGWICIPQPNNTCKELKPIVNRVTPIINIK